MLTTPKGEKKSPGSYSPRAANSNAHDLSELSVISLKLQPVRLIQSHKKQETHEKLTFLASRCGTGKGNTKQDYQQQQEKII